MHGPLSFPLCYGDGHLVATVLFIGVTDLPVAGPVWNTNADIPIVLWIIDHVFKKEQVKSASVTLKN